LAVAVNVWGGLRQSGAGCNRQYYADTAETS